MSLLFAPNSAASAWVRPISPDLLAAYAAAPALLPTFIAGEAIKAERLKVIDLGAQPESERIYLAHAEGRQPSATLRALAECLKKAFGDPPYWEIGKRAAS